MWSMAQSLPKHAFKQFRNVSNMKSCAPVSSVSNFQLQALPSGASGALAACQQSNQACSSSHYPAHHKPSSMSRHSWGCSTRFYSSSAPSTSAAAVAPQDDVPPARLQKMDINFCRHCGSRMNLTRPSGEKEWRHVCTNTACGYVDYANPKMVVGCIVEHQGSILLCRRAIEPGRGLWTVPAGYMELNESTSEGAARETLEEANAVVNVDALYAIWDIPIIGQTYILFRGKLAEPFTHSPGPESLETKLFAPADIPFDQLAFSSVATSLRFYLEDLQRGRFRLHQGVVDKRPGAWTNAPGSFTLRNHVALDVV